MTDDETGRNTNRQRKRGIPCAVCGRQTSKTIGDFGDGVVRRGRICRTCGHEMQGDPVPRGVSVSDLLARNESLYAIGWARLRWGARPAAKRTAKHGRDAAARQRGRE